MLPQYVRQVAPQYNGPQLAGLGARAAAGVGEAIAQFGNRLTAVAEDRIALKQREAERAAIVAAAQVDAELDDRYLKYTLGLKDEQRRSQLTATQTDPVTGESRSGYDIELDRFGDWMKAQHDELAENLPPRARELFDVEYHHKSATRAEAFVQTVDRLEKESVSLQARRLADAGRTAEALDLATLYQDRLGPAAFGQLADQILVGGATADLREVARISGWDAATQMLQDPAWQENYGLNVPQADAIRDAMTGFVNQGRAREIAERESRRETARDALNDRLAAGDLTYADIDASPLEEAEQQQYVAWMRQDADRRVSGQKIVTDEAVRHQLKSQALDITRGRAEYRDVVTQATAAKAAGKLDDEAYRDVLAAARSELSGLHAEALRSASRSAERQLVTVSESAIERYTEMMARGAPGAKDTLTRAQNQRQVEYRLVDLHDSQIREFLRANPEASGEELYRQSRKILIGLRKSDAAQRASLLDAWDVDAMSPPAADQASQIEVYDSQTRQRIENGKPAGPPMGLESMWESITEEERSTVLQLLRQGFTPPDILRHFEQQ